ESMASTAALPVLVDDASPLEPESACSERPDPRLHWALTCLGVDSATLGAAAIASMVDARGGGLHWSFSAWTFGFVLPTVLLLQNRGLYHLCLRVPVL